MIDETIERYMAEIRASDDPDATTRDLLRELINAITDQRVRYHAAVHSLADAPKRHAELIRLHARTLSANPGTAVQTRVALDCAEVIERLG